MLTQPLCRLDTERRQFLFKGQEKHLGPLEFDILAALAKNRGFMTRCDLIKAAYKGRTIPTDPRTIDQHIARIRGKTQGENVITTVVGKGYRADGVEVSTPSVIVGKVYDVQRRFGKKPSCRVVLDFDDLLPSLQKRATMRLS